MGHEGGSFGVRLHVVEKLFSFDAQVAKILLYPFLIAHDIWIVAL